MGSDGQGHRLSKPIITLLRPSVTAGLAGRPASRGAGRGACLSESLRESAHARHGRDGRKQQAEGGRSIVEAQVIYPVRS